MRPLSLLLASSVFLIALKSGNSDRASAKPGSPVAATPVMVLAPMPNAENNRGTKQSRRVAAVPNRKFSQPEIRRPSKLSFDVKTYEKDSDRKTDAFRKKPHNFDIRSAPNSGLDVVLGESRRDVEERREAKTRTGAPKNDYRMISLETGI